jgi:hypothetical protein
LRRLLIFAVALTLVMLGLVPLSGCAPLSSQQAESTTRKTQVQCDRMNMDESGPPVVTASETFCCFVSNARIPELRSAASGISQAARIGVLGAAVDTPSIQRSLPVPIVRELSPPKLQALLCTFLI